MGSRDLVTTSVSIPSELLERARRRAGASYRTFSQYISYLIDQDLEQAEAERQRRDEPQKPAKRPAE